MSLLEGIEFGTARIWSGTDHGCFDNGCILEICIIVETILICLKYYSFCEYIIDIDTRCSEFGRLPR
jgi:hypothetical protein